MGAGTAEETSVSRTTDFAWIALAIVAAVICVWTFSDAFPFYPREWTVSSDDAEAIALEHMRDLGELPSPPYIVTRVDARTVLEARLQELAREQGVDELRSSPLGRHLMAWEVIVYDRDGRSVDWVYRARISPQGELSELRALVAPEEARDPIDSDEARRRADRFLVDQGVDLSLLGEPELRSRELAARTDLALRYPDLSLPRSDELEHGVEVTFAGDQLTGFGRFYEDPHTVAYQSTMRSLTLLQQAWVFLPILLLPLVAVPFVRRYHAGEIGVKRGMQIFLALIACGLVTMLFTARAVGAGLSIPVLSRPQVTWVVMFQLLVLFFTPMGLLSFLSWSVGEAACRERAPRRLAAFDALFKGDWKNETFARAALRGTAAGLALLAANLLLIIALRPVGVWASTSLTFESWWQGSSWFSVPLLGLTIAVVAYSGLFGRLFVTSALEGFAGKWLAGIVASVFGALLFIPLGVVFPVSWSPLFWLVASGLFVALFLRYGILTSILAHLTAATVTVAAPALAADHPGLQLQAVIALLVAGAPLIGSFRYLWSGRRFEYTYEDVPPHVRRIAERERQKVELETARRIQTSILPELPPRLNGVELSHSYLPATEVGGDFYDVLALEDGRLAVAVGDVAGHGVSSGLVMSMAKSALAVQVSFNPDVEAVFQTLNRMVYQSARKRLLTTLCYALIDPAKRQMLFASAGHLFPYRISRSGEVYALESVSYPLGVRDAIDVRVRAAELEAEDFLFLFSDGVVEARHNGSDELFGFERLERSLRRHSGGSVAELRRGVLEDLEQFVGLGPREDDLTILVLGIP
jgi:hypothetical protein